MSTSTRFWNFIARRYARTPIRDEQAYQQKLSKTQDYLRPDSRVLEFGCGTGSTALVHAPHAEHVIGLDSSSNMIEIACEKAAAAGIENATFEVASIEAFDAADDQFDAVLAMSILHLLEDRDAVIDKVFRLLAPGGVFVSSTICFEPGWNPIKMILPVGNAVGLLPKLRFFPTEDLVGSITAAGFEVDYRLQPEGSKVLFLVARKPSQP